MILKTAIQLTERGLLPDVMIRQGIRQLLKKRLSSLPLHNAQQSLAHEEQFIATASQGPIALQTQRANEQHYELPAEFFQRVLGLQAKYSSGYWPDSVATLDEAEEAALETTAAHAQLADHQQILELGCGWGAMSLWMACHYPNSTITAVSNSHQQKQFIDERAKQQGVHNLTVITADMNDFTTDQTFDRVVSIEMFEHMRNQQLLLERISCWLKPDGLLLVHVFCHRQLPYWFEEQDDSDWMTRHFFAGGMMPSDRLFYHFQQHLILDKQWRWSGDHYQKTLESWLNRMDEQSPWVLACFQEVYGSDKEAKRWQQRWRLFFMACAELFGSDQGQQWWVSHYRFRPRVQAK